MATQITDISKALGQANQIPVYSLTSQRALKLINQPNTSLKDLAQTIGADQSLAAKLLRVVNSAAYALPRKITNVSEAIPYIGLDETRKIILAASAHALFGGTQSHETWIHALTAAHAAQALHKIANFGLDADDAFLAGLLHDIGKTFIQKQFPAGYQKVLEEAKNGADLLAAEKTNFGMDHAQVGAQMLALWNFPVHLRNAVSDHHFIRDKVDPLSLMVALANQMAHWNDGISAIAFDPRSMAYFGLDEERAIQVRKSIDRSIAQFEQRITALY